MEAQGCPELGGFEALSVKPAWRGGRGLRGRVLLARLPHPRDDAEGQCAFEDASGVTAMIGGLVGIISAIALRVRAGSGAKHIRAAGG